MYTYLQCGLIGWGFENVWSGLGAVIKGDPLLITHSSLWMFPIYGLASMLSPIYPAVAKYPFYLRGLIYMSYIFLAEYISGSVLQFFHVCPWNYSQAPFHIHGLVRPDFAPLWFTAGLIYEKLVFKPAAAN